MAGKVKFDKDSAFRAIIGRTGPDMEQADIEPAGARPEKHAGATKPHGGDQARVQRAYWLDKEIDKALKKKSLEEEKTLTEAINEALRVALDKYLEN